ncbi:MAG: SAM-dependent chlorinase/fluorinase, partial [Erysipelotrichaceae bacterium]|nr:SAM-dependent chlorinase/fluorinase [Erysipelotrichaceae bacterium]
EIVDPNFGNAWSNIPVAWLKSWNLSDNDMIEVCIQSEGFELILESSFAPTFGHVKPNECVLYHNELDCVAIALNQASFIKTYHISYGPQWSITLRRII